MNMIQTVNEKLLNLIRNHWKENPIPMSEWSIFVFNIPDDPYRAREYLTKECDRLNIEWRQP